jgi:cytochrome c oxidase subunit II
VRRLAVLAPAALAGCSGVQTPLDPWGAQAGHIAELTHVLFAGGTAIFLLTMGLLVAALLAPGRLRRAMGSRRFVIGGGIVFPVVTLAALLVYSLGISRALTLPGDAAPLRVEIIGRQYWWEVRYPELGEGAVTANELHLPVGRDVELHLTSGDVIHSVWIPNLHGKMDMIPGRVNRQRLRVDRTGVLRGQCTEFCGVQHTFMAFWVVAHEPDDFAAWVARQRAPVPPPANAAQAEGMRIFGEAGCGACHAVRGTRADGVIGPDLTHVGGRRMLAGWLDNSQGEHRRWLARTSEMKPGVRMPAFGMLPADELDALAAYLDGLE